MLADIVLFLAAAVIAVPLFKRLGLGSVLGYLAAGIAIGPWGLGLIANVEDILHFSEFGVVLLLFVIGLELQPSRLWRLRSAVFGLGGAQVVITTAAFAGLALWRQQAPAAALVAGFGLSMSSTAFVLQMLGERKELTDRHGRAAFAILLFQDLSVIPFLALLPFLSAQAGVTHDGAHFWIGAAKAALALGVVVFLGRYLLRPVLRVLAATQVPEIFTAAALLTVSGTALGMSAVGLSASLGAFLAGMLLADSEYHYELQADIEPFKGLLLGLFFIAVGMSANLGFILQEPLRVLTVVAALVLVKAVLLYTIGRLYGLPGGAARKLGVALSQGGEFAFVLFALARAADIFDQRMQDMLVVSVTLSMIATPPLYALLSRLGGKEEDQARPYDAIDVPGNDVIIAGFGPFGQIFGRLLRLKKIPFTVLEKNWQHVDFVRMFGSAVFYSDAGRMEVLRAAKADKARFFVLAISDVEESLRIAEMVRRNFPHLRIFAAARDRAHALKLMDLGVADVIRRAYGSSLELTAELLRALGESEERIQRDIARFRQYDHDTLLKQQAVHRDQEQLIQTARDASKELEQLFEEDLASQDGVAVRNS
ncbi:MAG: monovalent cation:proton antiporter-2 (CPA2) family protein [Nevskia sp.]|nr:monovalent cation:proton antiporter-2 (CPA2) family protein [Nevskia sp.]